MNELKVMVDYSISIEKMISKGNYDWKDEDITKENFTLPNNLKGGEVAIFAKLFDFSFDITGQEAILKIDKAGYRPATLVELLAVGEAYPDLQKEGPVIILGPTWRSVNKVRYVPALTFFGSKRRLDLICFDGNWPKSGRFLAIRK